ncbi:MAG: glycosyltransferase family 2 protein [Kiritimatiellae bacterium]|nr:glycosyltransferase family 2 protein [Kiritimatiellia bacterium]
MADPEHKDAEKTVSVAIVNFNGRATLPAVLESIFAQKSIRLDEVRLLDNNSGDGSVEFVRSAFPTVDVVRLAENRGPNPARNEGLRRAASDYVLVMDNDIVLAPDYVAGLMRAHALDPAAGAVTGQIRFQDRPDTVQYNGTYIHYAGEIMLNRRESAQPLRVGCVSAGAVLLDRRKVFLAGGFDEDFFIGWEDGDLTFRLALAGYPCYAVSRAVCFHIRRARNQKWARYQTRNRWWFIGKNYDARTFFLALPATLLLQVCAGLFFLFKGKFGAFCRGTWDALRSLPALMRKRKAVQSIKKVGDAFLLRGDRIDLPGGLGDSGPGRALNAAFSLLFRCYWLLIRPFLKKDIVPPIIPE